MQPNLRLDVLPADQLTPSLREAIYGLCRRAYEEDLQPLFEVYTAVAHVLGYFQDVLVSHAMWVTRWLQPGEGTLLRTAYVEMVTTEPGFQRRGFASAVMQRLAAAITDYDLGGLCSGTPQFYARLGWEFWRGPLLIRSPQGLIPTPEERVMILRLPQTPPLDLEQPLSAEWRAGELW